MHSDLRREDPSGDLSPLALLSDAWALCRDNLLHLVGGGVLLFAIMYGVQMAIGLVTQLLMVAVIAIAAMIGNVIGETAAAILMVLGYLVPYIGMVAAMLVVQTFAIAIYNLGWARIIRRQDTPLRLGSVAHYSIVPLVGVSIGTSAVLTAMMVLAGATGLLGAFGLEALGLPSSATLAFYVVASLLMMIPTIVALLGLSFAPMLVWDHKFRAMSALRASWTLMDGYKLTMLWLWLVAGALNFVGALACGLGLLVTAPVTMGAIMLFYNRIARPGNSYLG